MRKRRWSRWSRWSRWKTTDEREQVKIATSFFNNMFNKDEEKEIENITQQKIRTPFTKDEIKASVKSLRNGKSAFID